MSSEPDEFRDDHHLAQFKGKCDDLTAQLGEIVLVASAHLLDQAVDAQALEQAGDLAGVLVRVLAQVSVSEAANGELTAQLRCETKRYPLPRRD